ncbi:MAG: hypothetical protein LBS41_06015 [Streptococcaceae bacterium]|jgi:phosphoglycerate dehydrogenase-like enzyme|nr:hypothetical protein [Streptococcaceae bacterium]
MNILLTGAIQYTPEQLALLEDIGHKVYLLSDERNLIDDSTVDFDLKKIDIVVGNQIFQYTPLSSFPNLKLIQATSSGLDRMPLTEIKQRGIIIKNAAAVYDLPIAEYVLAVILDHYKKLDQFHHQQRHKKWIKNRDMDELAGQNALILGTGHIGSAVAKRLQAFDVRTTGLYHNHKPQKYFDRIQPMATLDQALPNADIVLLSLPETPDTLGIMNATRIALLKTGTLLINVSRGSLVDQDALVAYKKKAVLDVFKTEPLAADDMLWEQKNIFITPHNAFISRKNQARFFELLLKNIKEYDL